MNNLERNELKENVLDYINSQETYPLYFNSEHALNYNKHWGTETLVFNILNATIYFDSINGDGEWECESGAYRSSLDIWRHAKAVRPNVSIFQVLKALYNLAMKEKVYGQFCDFVERQVFRACVYDEDVGDMFDMEFNCEYGFPPNLWGELEV